MNLKFFIRYSIVTLTLLCPIPSIAAQPPIPCLSGMAIKKAVESGKVNTVRRWGENSNINMYEVSTSKKLYDDEAIYDEENKLWWTVHVWVKAADINTALVLGENQIKSIEEPFMPFAHGDDRSDFAFIIDTYSCDYRDNKNGQKLIAEAYTTGWK